MKNGDYILLIDKYLAGETTGEENEMLREWMADPLNREIFEEIRLIRENTAPEDSAMANSPEEELRKIHSKIASTEKKTRVKKLFFVLGKMKRVAAVLLLIGCGFLAWFLLKPEKSTEVALTTSDDLAELALPDGSHVYLNKNSSFSFEEQGGKRKGFLKGEAYFEISNVPQKPFFVLLDGATVKVVGTSFNVRTPKEGDAIEVVVTSGSVEFSAGTQKVRLSSNEKGVLDKSSHKIRKMANKDPNFASWKTGELRFANTNLGVILRTLEDHFGVRFQVADSRLKSCRFTGTFRKEELIDILEVLSYGLQIDFRHEKGRYVVSGKGCGLEK